MASPVTRVMRNVFTASFICNACGGIPHLTTIAHTGASSGSTSSITASSPASIPMSAPLSAGCHDPDTGASTNRPPASATRAARAAE